MTKTIYEVYNDTSVIPFATENEANEYIQGTNLGFQIRSKEIEVEPISTEDKLLKDIEFGKLLIKTFLKENRDIPRAFTINDNLMLLQKFAPIETLSRLGDIKTILILVSTLEVDEIFTQQRKDNFIATINNYLNG